MGSFVAIAVGYVVGARTGGKDLDEVCALHAPCASRTSSPTSCPRLRVHLAHTLREMATMVEHGVTPGATDDTGGDLVERVSQLVGRR